MPKNNNRNQYQDNRIKALEEQFVKVCDNYNHEITEIKIQISTIKADVCWIKKYFFIVAAASVGAFITAIFNLLVK